MSSARRLPMAGTGTATETFTSLRSPRRRRQIAQIHLAFHLDQVRDRADSSARGVRVMDDYGLADPRQAKTAEGLPLPLRATNWAP